MKKLLNWFQRPRAATQSSGPGELINTSDDLKRALNHAIEGSASGESVTPETAMRVAAVFASVRIICGAVANLPLHLKEREGDLRNELHDHALTKVLRRRPNQWQTPSQFKKMMQAHILLRGNAYALIVRSGGRVIGLLPLDPDRMKPEQADDLGIVYTYRHRSGRTVVFPQSDIMHLVGFSLDGVTGVSALTYARETIGLAVAQEKHGAKTFRNSARPSVVLIHPNALGKEGTENLRASLDEYRSGGDSEGKALILEEGMKIEKLTMTATDAQWLESRKFSRSEIAMFFGVPPHMIGDTEKSTSWGTGIEQQGIGFVTYTLEDHLTCWEESINRDLLTEQEAETIYARFNRKALVRGDIKTRQVFYTSMLQWGVFSPNEVRALEDMNPREGGEIYYDPPNTAGTSGETDGDGNEPSQTS